MKSVKQIYQDNNLHMQQLSYSCGPVGILNILQQKGDFSRSEEELAQLAGATPEAGTSHDNLITLAHTVGLEVVESKQDADIADIERNIDANRYVIVNFIQPESSIGHYAIVNEYDDKALYFYDCDTGFLRFEKKYFINFWHDQDISTPIERWYMAVR